RLLDQVREQAPARAPPAPAPLDVDGEVGDVAVRLAGVVDVQAPPADDDRRPIRVGRHLRAEYRMAQPALGQPLTPLLGRPELGLERRDAVLDALVVDEADGGGIARAGATDREFAHAPGGPPVWV